ncbi:MAG TPA: hypothetical protein PKC24_00445 [Cyclobacteriaceae bacterium]|nr:hypothetical protein [Cyclobacteriaceae bacterium]
MKTINYFLSLLLVATMLLFTSCGEDPEPENEEELITTVKLTFSVVGMASTPQTFTWRDLDGDGPNAPVIETITLQADRTYAVSIELLNESENPAEDITEEIDEERDEHLFCFEATNGLNLAITRTDTDGTFEVGLESEWVTGAASTGSVTVILKHQPGTKNGSCDPGEVDVEATFPVVIQ